eukprot:5231991-Ditylum_brightwellii.AAC.1
MNLFPNCLVTVENVRVADKVHEKDVGIIKGKTTRTKSGPVMISRIELPKIIKKLHSKVTIAANLMPINAILFMISTSRKIKFINIQMMIRRANYELF